MDSMRIIISVSKCSKETLVFVRWLEHRMRRVGPVRVRFLVQGNVGVCEMAGASHASSGSGLGVFFGPRKRGCS